MRHRVRRPPANPEPLFTRNDAFRRVQAALGPGLSHCASWGSFKDAMPPDEVYDVFQRICQAHGLVRPVDKKFFKP